MSRTDNKEEIENWAPVNLPIPEHWIHIDFEHAFTNVSLNGIKIPQNKYLERGGFAVIDQGQDLIGGYTDSNENVLSFAGPVIVFGDHTRCFKFINFPFAPGADGIKVLEPSHHINGKFAYYACLSIRLPDRGYSRHYSFLRRGRFPLPPFAEQGRIVAKIEELFSELDKGVETLNMARKQLQTLRESVLEKAIHSLAPGSSNPRPLSELIGSIQQGWSPKCELNRPPKNAEWAVIKTTAIQPMRYLTEECKPLPHEYEPRPHLEVGVGDLLMTRKGPRPRTGVVCLVRSTRMHSMLCDTVYRFRADESIVDPEYLEIALNSPSLVREINRRKSGISDSGISLNHGKIRTIEIPVPNDLNIQKNIVRYVSEKFSMIDILESEITDNLSRVELLRQSILSATFSGRLVTQDPEDEPASVLLERIEAEQARSTKNNNRKKAA